METPKVTIIGVVPGAGFVLERTESDGTRSVVPLTAWAITEMGDVLPLPLSLENKWTVRAATNDDDRLIRIAVARSRAPQPTPGFGPDIWSRS
jgi:hypothetical protein